MRRKSAPLETHVFLGDVHIPYEDKEALAMALDFCDQIEPDAIHLIGDILDLDMVSRFIKRADRLDQLGADLATTQEFLRELRVQHPSIPIVYSEGNHEERLSRFIRTNAPQFDGIAGLSVPELLGLGQLDIRWAPRREPYTIADGALVVMHGQTIRKWSGYTAHANVQETGCSVICGHTHRQGVYHETTMASALSGWENGCLCQTNQEYLEKFPNWQQGWSVATVRGSLFDVEQVRIQNGQYFFRGSIYP